MIQSMVTTKQLTDRTDLISERFHLYQTSAIPDTDTAVHDQKFKSTQTFCGLFCDTMTKAALYHRKKGKFRLQISDGDDP